MSGLRNQRLSECQFANRRQFQVRDIASSTARLLAERAGEFVESSCLGVSDLRKAFDMADRSGWTLGRALRDVPRAIAAARIGEVWRGLSSICSPGSGPTAGAPRARSTPRGGPEAPREFTYYLDASVDMFADVRRRRRWGRPGGAADVRWEVF
ncbi:unnamed protein product [Prorocentrum cordatum]|uniref:Uncharacterized protein n=1 Tax=Prorocentrum cordatum TaxID=2364126 RepID=A0ABN9TIB5_9DINO|nr:unnamed protein product [Polarella glacialis]